MLEDGERIWESIILSLILAPNRMARLLSIMNIKIKSLLTILFILSLTFIFYQRVLHPWLQSRNILEIRYFDPDELQHSHNSWYLSKGYLPYRDYFEHHTPLLYFQLAPVLSYYKPELSFEAAKSTLIVLRQLMSLWVACTFLLVIAIGWIWIGGRRGLLVGVTAAALLANMPYFWTKMIEVRPDVPAVTFYLAAVLLFLVGLKTSFSIQSKDKQNIFKLNLVLLFVAGFLLSIALLHTQKILFVGPGMALFWIWYVADPRWGLTFKKRILQLCSATFGFIVPIIWISAYFAYHNGLFEFYYYNLFFNFNWQTKLYPYKYLNGLWKSSNLTVNLAALGYIILCICCATKAARDRQDALLLLIASSAFVGLWFHPEPYLQSYQYLLPFIAIFAATFITTIIYNIVKVSLITLNYIVALRTNNKLVFRLKAAEVLTIVAILQCSFIFYQTPDLKSMQISKTITNKRDLAKIKWVMRNTSTEDFVVEHWPVYGVFRKHQWYYWSTHGPILRMISKEEIKKYEDSLMKGHSSPKLHTNVGIFRTMSKEASNYIQQNYNLTPWGYWMRKN